MGLCCKSASHDDDYFDHDGGGTPHENGGEGGHENGKEEDGDNDGHALQL
jgi:hypothetical protein